MVRPVCFVAFDILAMATIYWLRRLWHQAEANRAQWLHERRNQPTVRIRLQAPIRITRSR